MIKRIALLAACLFAPSLVHAFSPVQYVQISTNTLNRQAGTAMVAGVNVSTVTSSSATFVNMTASGTVSLGSAGNSVTVSSTTFLPGATFYSLANIDLSSATQVNISTVDWNVNGTLFQAERCAKELQFTITSATSTTIGAFVNTTLTGSITPHSTLSYIKVKMSGTMTGTANQNAFVTILRNGSNILSGTGGAGIVPPAGSVQGVPVSIVTNDSPSSISSVTYTVGLQSSGGVTATFCNLGTCTMTLQECL